MVKIIIRNIAGPAIYVLRNYQNTDITPLEAFKLFFSENMIMQITDQTNNKINAFLEIK